MNKLLDNQDWMSDTSMHPKIKINYMYTISKEFHFSASHHLDGLSEGHPCSNTHGHNYTIIIELQAKDLNKVGFVLDYREMDFIKRFIDSNLDHKHLNDLFILKNPTAENIARFLFEEIADHLYDTSDIERTRIHLKSVTVKETDKTSARYEP